MRIDPVARRFHGSIVTRALAVALLLMTTGCTREWVATRDEIELLPLESAKKVCRQHAEKRAERQLSRSPSALGVEREIDWATYQVEFRRCMKHQGWLLQNVPEDAEATSEERAPESDEPQPVSLPLNPWTRR